MSPNHLLSPQSVLLQQDITGSAEPSVADRSSEFVAVQGGEETSSAAGLLVAAYILMWVVVIALVWLSMKRLDKLNGRLASVEQALRKADQESHSPAP